MHGIMVPSLFGPFMWDFPKSNEITCVIHRGFYTQTLLHADAFTHTHVHTQTLLHTDAFTHRGFYTQTLLHTDAFTHRHIYTQTLLPTEAFTHTHTLFFYTHTLSHTEAFTHRRLHRDFTHRSFYTHTYTHTCSETAYRIIDVECIARAKTLQLNLTDTVKTVPFRGETERITKMM